MKVLPRSLTLALFVFVLASCGTSLPSSGSSSPGQEAPQQGLQAATTVICKPGEEKGYFEAFIGEDVPGGPATPYRALEELLSSEGKSMAAGTFEVAASSGKATQIVAEREGTRVFSAYAERFGDSWYVTELWACSNFLSSMDSRDA